MLDPINMTSVKVFIFFELFHNVPPTVNLVAKLYDSIIPPVIAMTKGKTSELCKTTLNALLVK